MAAQPGLHPYALGVDCASCVGGMRMGYAAGGGGPSGRFVALVVAGMAVAALAVGHGWEHLPATASLRGDASIAARDLAIADVRSLWIAYQGADGRPLVLKRPVPFVLKGEDESAWQRAFPWCQVHVEGMHVLISPEPDKPAFRIGIDRGQVVILAGRPELGVVVERTPLLAGTLPLDVRRRVYTGVPQKSVAEAWRTITRWMA